MIGLPKMIKITIIVPVYNVSIFLPKCLNSLIKQTLQEIEIICIDDCSTDNSVAIINEFMAKDSRIKLIKHSINQRQGMARNNGIKQANGEYIWFVDSDDYLNNDKALEEVWQIAKKHNPDLIDTDIDFILNGISKGESNALMRDFSGLNVADTKIAYLYQNWFTYYPCIAIFKREFLVTNSLVFPTNVLHEDIVIIFWKMLAKSIYVVPKAYYAYNMRSGSSSTSIKIFIHKDLIVSLSAIKELMRDNNLYDLKPYFLHHVIYLFFHLSSSRLAFLHANTKERNDIVITIYGYIVNLGLTIDDLNKYFMDYDFFKTDKINFLAFKNAMHLASNHVKKITVVKTAFGITNLDIFIFKLKQIIKKIIGR